MCIVHIIVKFQSIRDFYSIFSTKQSFRFYVIIYCFSSTLGIESQRLSIIYRFFINFFSFYIRVRYFVFFLKILFILFLKSFINKFQKFFIFCFLKNKVNFLNAFYYILFDSVGWLIG